MKPTHRHTNATLIFRRSFFLFAGVALTAAVIACAGDSPRPAPTVAPQPAPTTAPLLTATPAEATPAPSPVPGTRPPTTPVNACALSTPEQIHTPSQRAPRSAPFANATPVRSTPETPEAEVVAYPDLPPPPLPASVKSWQGAVVGVSVELAGGRTRNQQGLVVSDGAVLTVLDLLEEIASLSVKVPGRGAFAAELERFDLRTGAALLTIRAEGLAVAPEEHATVSHGEPVLLLGRDHDSGELVVEDTFASPSINAPDDIFALRANYTPGHQRGVVVVTANGTPVGLSGHGRKWYGQQVVLGGIGGIDLPAVLLDSALRLVESVPSDAGITPAAVAYFGPTVSRPVDGPVTRELLAEPVQATITDLGEPVPLENLDRRPGSLRPTELGAILELLYATPQELRGADGEVLGSARYIALWWGREGGAPDLVLCEAERGNHLGAAFAARGLGSFETLMERAPFSSPHSMVAAAPLDAPEYGYTGEYGYSREDFQYPYEWELNTGKSAYVQDEPVTLTFTITNASDWPAPLDYVPPRVTIYSVQEHRNVAVLHHGDGRRVLQPGETASFTMTWDQMHFEGGRASTGRYVARVQLANLVTNWWLDWGPVAYEVILE